MVPKNVRTPLLAAFGLSKSSYFYQKAAVDKPDKYKEARGLIFQLFTENYRSYGYRRLWWLLKRAGICHCAK